MVSTASDVCFQQPKPIKPNMIFIFCLCPLPYLAGILDPNYKILAKIDPGLSVKTSRTWHVHCHHALSTLLSTLPTTKLDTSVEISKYVSIKKYI